MLQHLPQTEYNEAMNISKLCGGLPQVIRVLCQSCKRYGLQPREMLLRLQKVNYQTRLKTLSPQLF